MKSGLVSVALVVVLFGCAGSQSDGDGKIPVSPKTLHLQDIATGLNAPMEYHVCSANTNLAYVIERGGRVILLSPTGVSVALDVSSLVSTNGEGGLLGMALDPDFATNRYVYLHYTVGSTPDTQIARFTMAPDFRTGSASTVFPIIKVTQPFSNHKGGSINFGPDKMLYMGLGDGGSGNDPNQNAQNKASLLGKFLRIDPRGDDFPADSSTNYHVPADNPFVSTTGVRPEIWSVGWRNPFRWQFDSKTGGPLVADVGQNAVEEFDYEPPGKGGRNYGWRIWEGDQNTGLGGTQFNSTFTPPFHVIDHPEAFAIVGGFIYRGRAIPGLSNRYLFGDYVTSKFWSSYCFFDSAGEMQHSTPGMVTQISLVGGLNGPVSINPDKDGEPVICELNSGKVRRVVP